MREYKFRAKPKQTGGIKSELAWAYGDLVQKNGKAYIAPSHNAVKVENNLARLMVLIEIDPETVGQYTGLRDRDGKEIYEGDILEGYDGIDGYLGCKHVIQYFQPDCRYISIFAHEFASGKWDETNESVRLVWVECEVIGNLWDNSDLLGEARM